MVKSLLKNSEGLARMPSVKDSGLMSFNHPHQIWKLMSMEKDFIVSTVELLKTNPSRVFKSNLKIFVHTYVQQLQRVKEKFHEKHPAVANTK